MSEPVLEKIQSIIQRDVNHRGLASDPNENLLTACQADFAQACQSLARTAEPVVALVTGFYIPHADAAETDGPLGSVFLARALAKLGARVLLAAEPICADALKLALFHCGLDQVTTLIPLPPRAEATGDTFKSRLLQYDPPLTHLIAVERVGPSHTPQTHGLCSRSDQKLAERFHQQIPPEHHDQYHTMRGRIITDRMYPAHGLFEHARERQPRVSTIGIGDGGNEIGMGKIPWEVIARNIPNGGLVACRVPTDYNIVCGVSNWGAYGLAAGIWHLRGKPFDADLFDADAERDLWERVLRRVVLVDGVTGERTLTVDGLSWDEYIHPLREIARILKEAASA